MSANWPIRVGGDYEPKPKATYRRVVTAIDGETVYYMLRSNFGAGEWSEPHGDVGNMPAEVFRLLSHPEDVSPIPELIVALKGVYAGYINSCYEERVVVNISREAWVAVESALAKAGAL